MKEKHSYFKFWARLSSFERSHQIELKYVFIIIIQANNTVIYKVRTCVG